MARLINLTYNTDECVTANVSNLRDLGLFAIENGMFENLDALPLEVQELLDFEEVGKRLIERNGGVFVDGMYVEFPIREEEIQKPYTGLLPYSEAYHVMRVSVGDE